MDGNWFQANISHERGCMTSAKDDSMSFDCATSFHHPRTFQPLPFISLHALSPAVIRLKIEWEMMELNFFTGTHLGCKTSAKDDSMSLDCTTSFRHPRTFQPLPSISLRDLSPAVISKKNEWQMMVLELFTGTAVSYTHLTLPTKRIV